ncbi:hypothetical protein BD410DRAFT_830536 [Rickenella mellea]|uniref:DUF6534 domain-containing protein n=1 Tax=Rickenella mellea TaxID=50990 RepID=A0A4Y7PUL6_9AGAM|nr:hypothetical protein BD410DRAFT_830536 [Rickenella mellea]
MSVGDTFGAAFIGLIASAIREIFRINPIRRLTPRVKVPLLQVGFIWVVDSIHLASCIATTYWYLVSNFGNFSNLGVPHWTFGLQTVASTTVILSVQLFFVRRVYNLGKNILVAAVIVAFAVTHFALGTYLTVASFNDNSFAPFKVWVGVVGLGSAAVADVLIAMYLVLLLRKSRTGFAPTDHLIAILIRYSLRTGLLTSVVAIITVIIMTSDGNNAFNSDLGWRLLDALKMLNSREALREIVKPVGGSAVQFSHTRSTAACESPNHKNSKPPYGYAAGTLLPRLEVTVEIATDIHSDIMPPNVDKCTSPTREGMNMV